MGKIVSIILIVMAVLCARAQTNSVFTRLISFDGTNGGMPNASFILARDGKMYGTTCRGGVYGKGAIYKVTPDGILTTIFSFDGTNGWSPLSELAQGQDGKLYGVCFIAGVFTIACDGTGFKILHPFSNENTPQRGLTLGPDGYFYGYMPFGGVGNNGAVFKISSKGDFQIVLSCDWPKTGFGCDGLILGHDGCFYGTMGSGGKFFAGSFFRLTTNGVFTTLASFDDTNEFRVSRNQLIEGANGNFYGTTEFGGAHNSQIEDNDGVGDGTLFMVSTNGTAITLASFNGLNGAHPRGKLIQDSDGSFYGVTLNGLGSQGTIFKATTNGDIACIYRFGSPDYEYALTNGGWPCGLIRVSNSDFYGVTMYGGKFAHLAGYGSGTIFKYRVESEAENHK
jgi:uncharacterized repeat protein (TIGR03803 family)